MNKYCEVVYFVHRFYLFIDINPFANKLKSIIYIPVNPILSSLLYTTLKHRIHYRQ